MMLAHLRIQAESDSARIALDPVDEAPISYSDLTQRVGDLAEQLGCNHSPSRPVALQLDHGSSQTLLELALLQAGIPVLSLPSFYSEGQVCHAISKCGAGALIHKLSFPEVVKCDAAPAFLPAGTARVTFTSGSTATPKGVCLSANHMLEVATAVIERVGFEHAGRHLAVLPPGILLETIAGMFATLLAGGTYVCPPQALIGLGNAFRPDFAHLAKAIDELRITSLILVPEYLSGLVRVMEATGLRLPLLTLVAVGGARTAPDLISRGRALGLPIRQGYGLTEFGSVVSLGNDDDEPAGSVGQPLRHIRATVAPDGEILLDGPVCLGTVGSPRDPDLFATGDLGLIDEFGRLWIEGRKSNLIISSFGRNISPEWIEEVLLSQPDIAQALVHGEGLSALEALLVPAHADADLSAAVFAANAALPAYARIAAWREAAHFTPLNGHLTGNGRLCRGAIAQTYLSEPVAFFVELEAATIRERLSFLSIPQVKAGLAGDIDRKAYVTYLTRAWHHVRHTVPLLRAARERVAERPDLAAALDSYIAEETGHEKWILSDITAAGGDAEAVRCSMPDPATRAMVDHAYAKTRNSNPVSLFGMIYVLESVSIALAQRGALAVQQRLDLPPEAFTYLMSHGELDQAHMSFFAAQVNGLDNPADRTAIIAMAKEMFGLFGGVFASIPLENEDVAAQG